MMLRRSILSRPTARSFSSCTNHGCIRSRIAPPLQHPFSRASSGLTHAPTLSSFSCLSHGDTFYSGAHYTQHRCFFFGNSGNDNDDDNDKKGKDSKDEKKEEDKKEDDKENNKEDEKDASSDPENSSDDSEPSPSLDNSSKHKKMSSSTVHRSSSSPNILLPASRLGFGDQAPRYPHLMALPVTRGPVFPGVLTPITITDQVGSFQCVPTLFSFVYLI
mmetsp:Transcript_19233/g.35955  ORF Transcript_19233/g.35955 Transcript_19233/m.35955 type:complete len:218 (+) Transcript_19233:206-859(+)